MSFLRLNAGFRLPPVIAIALRHGKSKFASEIELSKLFVNLPGIATFLPKFRAVLFDLNTIAGSGVLEIRRLIRLIRLYLLYSAARLDRDYKKIQNAVQMTIGKGEEIMPTEDKAEGKAEGKILMMLRILKIRFGSVPG